MTGRVNELFDRAAGSKSARYFQDLIPVTSPTAHVLGDSGKTIQCVAPLPVGKWEVAGGPFFSGGSWIIIARGMCPVTLNPRGS